MSSQRLAERSFAHQLADRSESLTEKEVMQKRRRLSRKGAGFSWGAFRHRPFDSESSQKAMISRNCCLLSETEDVLVCGRGIPNS